MEQQIRTAIVEELKRQAEASPALEVRPEEAHVVVQGPVDIDALAMAIVGAVAGGP